MLETFDRLFITMLNSNTSNTSITNTHFNTETRIDSLQPFRTLGLNPSALWPALSQLDWSDDAQLWRITELHRDRLGLQNCMSNATLNARVLPAMNQALASQGESLAVGDWVLARRNALNELWVHARAAPLNTLNRRDPEGRRQALVSNVDLALLVMGLDHDFKLARLDRYLVLTHSAGVPALVVLTKADQCPDVPTRIAQVRAHLAGSPGAVLEVLALDGTAPSSRQALLPWLGLGQTLVMLGSSGAGKSTLSNTLSQTAQQQVGGVRLDDSRGRHTTTARSLQRCVGGACIIDTPGLRSLQLDADEAAVLRAFDDVQSLAQACRFRNCAHQGEPGCAVQAGLNAQRLKSFHKLQREASREQMTHLDRQEALAKWKTIARASRAVIKSKRG
ncbi:ribosome small subunit-dependent GTPase A [Paucibacter sp. Y2R2-4]|uniref:ribosome small subunit-dependent GTPase A n=1 Tax=Paucibacter sp. Y2R2-4 TaxID=2893553 RepID=UPI0021E3AC30|nr:ribosome small subunit-dependent GTPase A [Paucibacter sp. Y2R2-4]MCV2349683.1 ribosome small subunit-dependent GTPase A [Paucibacter sp. Y2R2-4]